jgi:hypothetical protein
LSSTFSGFSHAEQRIRIGIVKPGHFGEPDQDYGNRNILPDETHSDNDAIAARPAFLANAAIHGHGIGENSR